MIDFSDALLSLGIDLSVLNGVIHHIYEASDALQVVEPDDGSFRLELEVPVLETRDEPYRLGLHLYGQLFIGLSPDALVFDSWSELAPALGSDEDGMPIGRLEFVAVEEVQPGFASGPLTDAFAPDGAIGDKLGALELPVFTGLLENVTRQLLLPLDFGEGEDEEPPIEVDVSLFSVAFYLGRPVQVRRPMWDTESVDGSIVPVLDFEFSDITRPSLMATVAFAGATALPPESPSLVRPNTGLSLTVTQTMLQARLDREAEDMIGSEVEGLTIDSLEMGTADFGFTVAGEGHKTGADVSFEGEVVARYTGSTDGHLRMKPAIETDVDLEWWATLLSVALWFIPGIGWLIDDLFISGPANAAPGKVSNALTQQFAKPVAAIGAQLSAAFEVPEAPSSTFLSDLWFFDGNLGVAAVALAGRQDVTITSVTRDTAFIAADPLGAGQHENRRKPVTSVETIGFSSGHRVTPWQAAELLANEIIELPGFHVVRNEAARGGMYLRSNPNETDADNLLA